MNLVRGLSEAIEHRPALGWSYRSLGYALRQEVDEIADDRKHQGVTYADAAVRLMKRVSAGSIAGEDAYSEPCSFLGLPIISLLISNTAIGFDVSGSADVRWHSVTLAGRDILKAWQDLAVDGDIAIKAPSLSKAAIAKFMRDQKRMSYGHGKPTQRACNAILAREFPTFRVLREDVRVAFRKAFPDLKDRPGRRPKVSLRPK